MENKKNIEIILDPPPYHWVGNGFKVHNFMPRAIKSDTRMSPFFLLDYNAKMYYSPSNERRGVGVHPHRGLETVTIAYHGKVAHHDSAGNGGVISEGDVQWMTAGKGILHKEYQEAGFVEKGGDFQMVQLWVNLPAKHKMTAPKYQEIPNASMGKFISDDQKVKVNVIAGEFRSVKGPAQTFTTINLFDVRAEENSSIEFVFEEKYNTAFLVIEGKVTFNNSQTAETNQLVLFENKGTQIHMEADIKSTVLVMNGEPINEAIYPYGPFLMNTQDEIQKAYEEYYKGLFGHLDD
jgi:quercetin 2,3-dioxygenase